MMTNEESGAIRRGEYELNCWDYYGYSMCRVTTGRLLDEVERLKRLLQTAREAFLCYADDETAGAVGSQGECSTKSGGAGDE